MQTHFFEENNGTSQEIDLNEETENHFSIDFSIIPYMELCMGRVFYYTFDIWTAPDTKKMTTCGVSCVLQKWKQN